MAGLSLAVKNMALQNVKAVLQEHASEILQANQLDKKLASEAVTSGSMSSTLYKRLDLEGSKWDTLLVGIDDVAKLADPTGQVTLATKMDDGLELYRVTCPIGVICIIFEARPEAAVQISALAIKSGNAIILKGGREAQHSNQALITALRQGLAATEGFPMDAVQLVSTREEVQGLLRMDEYIDLIIPRGSNELVRSIKDNTRIPVMGHADGICAVYIDQEADVAKATRVVVDAKTQYAAACNATETLLVHESVFESILVPVGAALHAAGVKMRADEKCLPYLPAESAVLATESDFKTEFLEFTIAIKSVGSVHEAIQHINSHGSHHTDSILTENQEIAKLFLTNVDSACVFHNASTRFADGFRFGFGAEVGVSTNRLHARGPVGLEGLVTYKYRIYGNGQTVADYSTGSKSYEHTPIPKQVPF
eukprot:GILJ01002813.1.p1 GENE.GILJ01002813.1~~GILJ01002813.1.p1  ORF type:complete len:448 (-),score=66.34 GILJ01002813.1:223-1494(-)